MRAEAVAVRISVGEYAGLQHFIRRETNAGNDVRRAHCYLLNLGEVIVGIAVEFKHTDINQRIFTMRPDFCNIERIVGCFICI